MSGRKPRPPRIYPDTPYHVRMIVIIRSRYGWNQDELGAMLNVTGRTVRRWEKQTTEPKTAWIVVLEDLLKQSKADIKSA